MSHDFAAAARKPLQDPAFRATFRKAMDGLMGKRAAQFADPQEWTATRALAESVRQRALSQLPDLLERLEENCTRNGITVHWAETTQDANEIVLSILQKHDAKTVVKGKSMVSEEMHLNDFLDGHGIEATEADLGEYIVQMEGNGPAHIIMPAIHLNRQQIAQLFRDKLKTAVDSDEAAALTALARKFLREKFAQADAGISGVNFAVAETGTLCLVENEGNGRMATTIPPVHIALMGIEKVVEKLEDVAPLLSILPRSATGQPITTYFNVISGPRKDNELDGPQEVHLVILDNGRARAFADEQLRRTLQCIRCGACMNHCPVYARVGGHSYGGPYPGPLGKILLPQIDGLEDKGDLPHASSLCNACVEVCPVRIPIADILVRLRTEASTTPGPAATASPGACGSSGGGAGVAPKARAAVFGRGARYSRMEGLVWKAWATIFTSPTLYKLMGKLAPRLLPLVPSSAPGLKNWTSCRTKPTLARKTLHDLAREEGLTDD